MTSVGVSTSVAFHRNWSVRGSGYEDRVALTSSRFVLEEEEILFRPCLRGSGTCVTVTGCGGLPFQFLSGSWGFLF